MTWKRKRKSRSISAFEMERRYVSVIETEKDATETANRMLSNGTSSTAGKARSKATGTVNTHTQIKATRERAEST